MKPQVHIKRREWAKMPRKTKHALAAMAKCLGDAIRGGWGPKGFKRAPTRKGVLPTEREKRLLKELRHWQAQSKRSTIILGKPAQPNGRGRG